MLVGAPRVRERRQLAAEVDEVLVAFRPVVEEREFLGDRGLRLRGRRLHGEHVDGRAHARFLIQRTPWGVSSRTIPSLASWSRIASDLAKSRERFAAARSSI